MKKLLLLVACLCFPHPVLASELTAADAGTFVVIGQNGDPTNVFYRLSYNGTNWVAEGKLPDGSWKNVSCDTGCDYRTSSPSEALAYMPPVMRDTTDISCIQNVAQAFCKYSQKNAPQSGGYVIIALVTGKPLPMFVQRVSKP